MRTLLIVVFIMLQTPLVKAHNAGKGAKYTKGRRPVKLVYHEQQQDRSSASMREIEIKSLSREQKENLIKDS